MFRCADCAQATHACTLAALGCCASYLIAITQFFTILNPFSIWLQGPFNSLGLRLTMQLLQPMSCFMQCTAEEAHWGLGFILSCVVVSCLSSSCFLAGCGLCSVHTFAGTTLLLRHCFMVVYGGQVVHTSLTSTFRQMCSCIPTSTLQCHVLVC